MSLIENAVQLKKMLVGMERDIGLDELSDPEKTVLYSFIDLDVGEAINSGAVRDHILTLKLSKPTFHRALKSLVKKGFVTHEAGTKTAQYRLRDISV